MKEQLSTIPDPNAAVNGLSVSDVRAGLRSEDLLAAGGVRGWSARDQGSSITESLFWVCGSLMPEQTRQVGPVIGLLRTPHLPGFFSSAPIASEQVSGKRDAVPPNAQPPPAIERRAFAMA